MARSINVMGFLGLAVGAYAVFVRPRLLRWGATPDELRDPFPGAGIIPGGKRGTTMAVTIDAPPSRIWPWLVQMGYDRAGWYSWDRLDRAGIPSASEINPEWQSISIGQRLQSEPKGPHWFEVAALEPERFLGLRAAFHVPSGRQYDSAEPRPARFVDTLWGFWLKELPGGRTRLIVSGYTAVSPRWLNALTAFLFWEPAHWLMQTRQFANLKRRAERQQLPASAASPATAFRGEYR